MTRGADGAHERPRAAEGGRARRYQEPPAGYLTTVALDDDTARRLLEDERASLQRALRAVTGDLRDEETGISDELTSVDQHAADLGTQVHDISRDLGLRTDLRRRLEENAAAFDRLEAGRYGVCERCGRPIDDDRLRAVPSTRYCAEDEMAVAEGR